MIGIFLLDPTRSDFLNEVVTRGKVIYVFCLRKSRFFRFQAGLPGEAPIVSTPQVRFNLCR